MSSPSIPASANLKRAAFARIHQDARRVADSLGQQRGETLIPLACVQIGTVLAAKEQWSFVEAKVLEGPEHLRGASIALTGTNEFLRPGAFLQVQVSPKETHRGISFRLDQGEPIVPKDLAKQQEFLTNGTPGLSPQDAKRLIDRSPRDWMREISKGPDFLLRHTSLNLVEAKRASDLWSLAVASRVYHQACENAVLTHPEAVRLREGACGRVNALQAITMIRRDAGILARSHIPVAKATQVARALGGHDPNVSIAVNRVLNDAREDGHTFAPLTEVIVDAAAIAKVPRPDVSSFISGGRFRIVGNGLMTEDLYQDEVGIAWGLRQITVSNLPMTDRASIDGFRRAAVAKIPSLTTEQASACEMVLSHGVSVVTGGPGTGKTTAIRAMLAGVLQLGIPAEQIAFAAPTGKAARRMTESAGRDLGQQAVTLHRLLGWSPTGFKVNREHPLPHRVVIVDEASMIDVPMMHALVKAIPGGCRLVLVGDEDQLPPVGPGCPLRDFMANGIPTSRLTVVQRQALTSNIIRSAHAINRGQIPSWDKTSGDSFWWTCNDPDMVPRLLDMVTKRIPERFGHPPEDIRVLAPAYGGAAGIVQLNRSLQDALNPLTPGQLQASTLYGEQIRKGDRIVWCKNRSDHGLVNGQDLTVAKVEQTQGRIWTVLSDEQKSEYRIPTLDLHARLGYALSIHKSQGSEYPAVVTVLPMEARDQMSRAHIYTAITRAKKLHLFLASADAFHLAIATNEADRRRTITGALLRKHLSPEAIRQCREEMSRTPGMAR